MVWFEVEVPKSGVQWGEARVQAVLDDNCYSLAGKIWDHDWLVHPHVETIFRGGRPDRQSIQRWTVSEALKRQDHYTRQQAQNGCDEVLYHRELGSVPGEALVRVWDRVMRPECPTASLQCESAERPTLEVARERLGHNLGFGGATQQGLGPEMWGMTLEQLQGVRKLPGFRGDMSMYDVVSELIVPLTKGGGVGYALSLNALRPLRATYMISHAWNELYVDFLDALSDVEVAEGAFWVCAMAIYQCEDVPEVSIQRQLGNDVRTGPFSTVLKQADRMIAVLTPAADIYTRMWCVLEIFVAVQEGVPVELAALSRSYTSQGVSSSLCDAVIEQSRAPCNSCLARCGNPAAPPNSDELAIRALVEAGTGSYETLDSAVEWAKAIYFVDKMESGRGMLRGMSDFQIEPAHPLLLGGGARFDLLAKMLSATATTMARIARAKPVLSAEEQRNEPQPSHQQLRDDGPSSASYAPVPSWARRSIDSVRHPEDITPGSAGPSG